MKLLEQQRELLERFAEGELDAFEKLFRQFQGEVYGWILSHGQGSGRGRGPYRGDVLEDLSSAGAIRSHLHLINHRGRKRAQREKAADCSSQGRCVLSRLLRAPCSASSRGIEICGERSGAVAGAGYLARRSQ